MAAPRRWRNIAATLTAAGLLVAIAGVVAPAGTVSVDGRIGAVVGGVLTAMFCGLWAAVKHGDVRMIDRLGRGEDVLARWRVDPDTWARFVEHETALREAPGAHAADLRLPATVPPRGVDIVVGRAAVLVGDEVHHVPERGNPEVDWARLDDSRLRLAYVEMSLLYHPTQAGASPEYRLFRFPVADGSLAPARAAVAHFARETPQRPDFFHGPGDGTDPEDLATCWQCGFETHKLRSYCPKCGAPMQSRRWSRRSGVVLMFLGVLIAGGVGALLLLLLPSLMYPGVDVGGARFTGSPGQARTLFGILAGLCGFGVVAFAYGVYQLVTGKRSLRVVQAMLGLVAVVVAVALLLAR